MGKARDVHDLEVSGPVVRGLAPKLGELSCKLDVVSILDSIDSEAGAAAPAAAEEPAAKKGFLKRASTQKITEPAQPSQLSGEIALVPRLHIKLASVTLNEKGSMLPGTLAGAKKGAGKVEYVNVEVDMLGTEKDPMKTAVAKLVKKGKGVGCALSFAKDYRAERGSKLALKYLEALKSPEKE